jgi:hypothetical protein
VEPESQTVKCTVTGCNREYRARGLCVYHYNQHLHQGTLENLPRFRMKDRRGSCRLTSCNQKIYARGLCGKHYSQLLDGKLGVTKERERHGMEKLSEYIIWKAMKQRCLNPRNNNYKNYGGRGIKLSERWIDSFMNFYADMGPRPSPRHSIERKNNDGNYEPGNCRWATRAEQAMNKRQVKLASSGKRHIYWRKRDRKWRVRIVRSYKEIHVGTYKDLESAIQARDEFLARHNLKANS